MDEEKQLMRVSFNLHITNPEHKEVYELIKDIKNKNGYIRDAVLYYASRDKHNNSLSLESVENQMKDIISRQENMERKMDMILELLSTPQNGNAEVKSTIDSVAKEKEEPKKSENGFERFKNMF